MRPIVSIAALLASVALVGCLGSTDTEVESPATAEETATLVDANPAAPQGQEHVITATDFVARATQHLKEADKNNDGVLTKEEFQAHRPGPPHGPPDMDADKDGKITVAEGDAMARRHFAMMDQDKDGLIPVADLPPPPPDAPAFDVDANHDGNVTVDELIAAHRAHFKERDANNDGELAGDELMHRGPPPGDRPHRGDHGERGEPGNRGERGDRGPGDGAHGPRGHRGPPAFEELDANKDGQVSLAEIQASAQKHFAQLDKNGDSQLSGDELPKHGMRGPGQRGPGQRGPRGEAPPPPR